MMSYLKVPLALLALAIVFGTCCCGALGGLVGVEFTTGDFADVPPYPGSTQTTESNDTLGLMTMAFSLIPGEAEWKHYTTDDSESDVLDWYADNMPDQGWEEISPEDMEVQTQSENAIFFAKSNVMLVVFAVSGIDDTGDTHIIVGRIVIEEE
jgi:hypothetical protein